MSYTASKLVAIAAAEVGYKEKASNASLDDDTANAGSANYTKYARDLAAAGYYNGNKNGYAWCDVFVDWCFYQLTGQNKTKAEALECQTGTLGAGTGYSEGYYKAAGRLDSTPKVGDQVFFQQNGNCVHTGIVETVTSSKITTIEGNSGNQVKRNSYSLTNSYIRSFGHPLYDEEETTTTTTEVTATLDAGTEITLSGANLYASSGASKAAGTKTGMFYIWSSAVSNGRIRITNSAANVGKTGQVTGWVDTSDCTTTTTSGAAMSNATTSGGVAGPVAKNTATDSAASFLKSLAGTYTVTANSGLNVRNGAGTGKSIMVTLPKGTSVKNYGYYTASGGVKWLYIQVTYNSVTYTGFASSAYLKKS